MARPRLIRPTTLLVVLPLAAATACGGASGHSAKSAPSAGATATATKGPDGVQQVTIDATDNFRFAPATIQAHVGKLRIVLIDAGSYPHNISFPTLHETSATVSGNPGQQKATLTVTLNHQGSYEFLCTFHSSAGMKGSVTVT